MSRVLIVDEEPQMTRALHINLKARHYDVATAPDGTTALQLASRNPPDAVILDAGRRGRRGRRPRRSRPGPEPAGDLGPPEPRRARAKLQVADASLLRCHPAPR
ncbi:MAG: two-component system, OmpR family, operon response regulator KdpE [Streptomyces sp.]|jgi:DNA-binding NarL/FixJ family response regulator|nr:two-component system, OmpR family, operon response regulator KdpE [Streptomyces sp.]